MQSIEIGGETYVQVKDYPKYYVSSSGNVYSLYRKRILTWHDNGIGYRQVFLTNNDGRKWKKIHRLVAQAFIPNPDNLPDINHKDLDKNNNDISNLEWCTRGYNIQHSFDNGRNRPTGKRHWAFGKKLSDELKNKLTLSKTGEKHHLFKGWYHTPNGTFTSLRQAAIALKINPEKIKTLLSTKPLQWWFEPKNKSHAEIA